MNAELFRWARETAGLSLDQAAKSLGIKDAGRLVAIETGAQVPSRPLLLKMARQYRRPLVTFYLAAPPAKGDRGQDFRTLPKDRTVADDALLDAMIRDVKARQAVVRSLAEDEDDAAPLPFIGSATMRDGVEAVLASIESTLGIDVSEYRQRGASDEAFSYLRNKAEGVGIFVLLIGNLGSHHSAIAVETFRGFAIADEFAPFVIINDQDANTAWSFTLLHEIAHLWLGTTGVSGTNAEKAIEKFCNEVASSFLLSLSELTELRISDDMPPEEALQLLRAFAKERHVSQKMVAYALFRSARLSLAGWERLDSTLNDQWTKDKAAQKERKARGESGPNYYIVRRHRLGRALLDFVDRSIGAGALTPVKAAKVLGVKPRSVYPLLMTLGQLGAAGLRG